MCQGRDVLSSGGKVMAYRYTGVIAFWALLVVGRVAHGYIVDCTIDDVIADYTRCGPFYYSYFFYFYCAPGLSCCNFGCCYNGPAVELYTTGELLGICLCVSALVVTGFLTLVICGATYCNNKEDKTAWQKNKS